MRYLLLILLCLLGYAGFSAIVDTVPASTAITQFSTGTFKHGVDKHDSGNVSAVWPDTNFIPRWAGFRILRRTVSDTSEFFWTGQRWKQVGSGNATALAAGQGVTIQNDSVQLGQPVTDFTGSSTINQIRFIRMIDSAGAYVPQLFFGNKPIGSYGLNNNSNHGGVFTPLTIFREFKLPDSNQTIQYNGIINTLTGLYPDSTTTQWNSPSNPLQIGIMGLYHTSRLRAMKNGYIFTGAYGNSGASFRSALDIGYFNSYNINITSGSGLPDFPMPGFESSIDLDRAVNNAQRRITGSPVSGLVTHWRSYQQNISGGTPDYGSSVGKIAGVVVYGPLFAHAESPSKAKTLTVSKVDSVYGVLVMPQWGAKNETVNGYGIATLGTLDINYFAGSSRIGGNMPLLGQMAARSEVRDITTGLTAASTLFMVTDSSRTFALSGNVSDIGAAFYKVATRASGVSNLTNIAIHARAVNGQDNIGILVDSGNVRIGTSGSFNAQIQAVHSYSINNTQLSTIPTYESYWQKDVIYNSNGNQTPTASFGERIFNIHRAGDSLTLQDDNIGALVGTLAIRKRSGYSGRTVIRGGQSFNFNINAAPSGIIGVFDLSQSSLSSGNSIAATGYWSAITAMVRMNTFDTVKNVAWLNLGGGQFASGSIDTGYVINMASLPSITSVKYAIWQNGSADSIRLNSAGIRSPNTPQVTDTSNNKPLVWNTTTGAWSHLNSWPVGSNLGGTGFGIDSTLISGTTGSVLFVGSGPVLAQDNANFYWDVTQKALLIGTNTTPSGMRLAINGGNLYSTNGSTGAAALKGNASTPRLTLGTFAADDTYMDLNVSGGTNNFNNKGRNLIFLSTSTANIMTLLAANGRIGTVGITAPSAFLHITASTTAAASLRVPTGTAPTSPNEGDIWSASNFLKYYNGSSTLRIPFTTDATAASGQLLYGNGTTYSQLSIGSSGDLLTSSGSAPQWTSAATFLNNNNVISDRYTPTLGNTTNVTSSSASSCHYSRIGNEVWVYGTISIQTTTGTNTLTNLTISLPIPSNLINGDDLTGLITGTADVNQTYGSVFASVGSDVAVVAFLAPTAATSTYRFSFMYQIQ